MIELNKNCYIHCERLFVSSIDSHMNEFFTMHTYIHIIRGENNAQHFEIQLIFQESRNYPNDIKIYSWLPIFCNDRACMWFGIGLKNVALVRSCLRNFRFLFALCFFKSAAWNGLWNPISLSDKSDKCWENKITIYARTHKTEPDPEDESL